MTAAPDKVFWMTLIAEAVGVFWNLVIFLSIALMESLLLFLLGVEMLKKIKKYKKN